MSFLKPSVNFGTKNIFQWWAIITYLFLGLMAGSIIMSAIFVYNYTFRTLEDAHTIVLLNTETLVNNVNMDAYHKAIKALGVKNNLDNQKPSTRNIFSFYVAAPTAPTTTTSSAYATSSP